jgi:hypothetical protein
MFCKHFNKPLTVVLLNSTVEEPDRNASRSGPAHLCLQEEASAIVFTCDLQLGNTLLLSPGEDSLPEVHSSLGVPRGEASPQINSWATQSSKCFQLPKGMAVVYLGLAFPPVELFHLPVWGVWEEKRKKKKLLYLKLARATRFYKSLATTWVWCYFVVLKYFNFISSFIVSFQQTV